MAMFNPFLNIWLIFLICGCVFLLYTLIYIKYIGNLQEIFIKSLYLSLVYLFIFIYFFIHDVNLWQHFSFVVNETLIIKDVQDLVNISIDLSLLYANYFVVPLLIVYLLTYFINYQTWEELKVFFFIFSSFCYYFYLAKYLLDNDLFLSNWAFFKKTTTFVYDFQPDLIYLVIAYLGDFYDLIIFFGLLNIYFLNFNWLKKNLSIKMQMILRFLINIFLSCFMSYFFGGEALFFDIILILLSFLSLEVAYFIYLFFYKLKYKVIY